ncbi:MAG: hypothetical protein ACJA0H_002163 [Francisellaceae bacterium]|jgi:hypothetical protein
MLDKYIYKIGTPGKEWGLAEKKEWLSHQNIKRSYKIEVLSRLEKLRDSFDVIQYSGLSYGPEKYPLYAVKTKDHDQNKPTVLVTGGVHGYETSGVQGAIRFLEKEALKYIDRLNIIVAPCISPWGYETINRWNPLAIDPNRSFYKNSPSAESAALMKYIKSLNLNFMAHIDLHETTDTDNSEFRPALAARDGLDIGVWEIPDGFYLCGDSENLAHDFQTAVIESVKKITHIAPSDSEGRLIGEHLSQEGVMNYDTTKLGLCIGFTNATYSTTTEVYPDSPKASDEECIIAQVAAITGGLDYIVKHI